MFWNWLWLALVGWRLGWRRLKNARHALGERGERLAERCLRRKGYRIVGRSVQNRYGELDLVAVDGRTLVFVEVKTRRRDDPEERLAGVVTDEQQRRITRAAFEYRKKHRLLAVSTRFDLINIVWPPDGPPEVRHILHALETTGLDDRLY